MSGLVFGGVGARAVRVLRLGRRRTRVLRAPDSSAGRRRRGTGFAARSGGSLAHRGDVLPGDAWSNLVLLAENRLSLPTENRVTALRIGFLVQFLLIVAWTLTLHRRIAAASASNAVEALGVVGGIHLALVALFAVTEDLVVPRRVRVAERGGRGARWLLALFGPGGGRGALYVLVQMAMLLALPSRLFGAGPRRTCAGCSRSAATSVSSPAFRRWSSGALAAGRIAPLHAARRRSLLLLSAAMVLPDLALLHAVAARRARPRRTRRGICSIRSARWPTGRSSRRSGWCIVPLLMGSTGLLAYVALIYRRARDARSRTRSSRRRSRPRREKPTVPTSSIDWAAVRAAASFRLAMPRTPIGGRVGERLGSGTGSSLEFQDYRPYSPGDDLRHVDWAAYARSELLAVRLYREEVAPRIDLVLDVSRSMAVDGARSCAPTASCRRCWPAPARRRSPTRASSRRGGRSRSRCTRPRTSSASSPAPPTLLGARRGASAASPALAARRRQRLPVPARCRRARRRGWRATALARDRAADAARRGGAGGRRRPAAGGRRRPRRARPRDRRRGGQRLSRALQPPALGLSTAARRVGAPLRPRPRRHAGSRGGARRWPPPASWRPHDFATPLGLLALLAIPAIIAIHLFRRRFPVRPVAGLFLWQACGRRPKAAAGSRAADHHQPDARMPGGARAGADPGRRAALAGRRQPPPRRAARRFGVDGRASTRDGESARDRGVRRVLERDRSAWRRRRASRSCAAASDRRCCRPAALAAEARAALERGSRRRRITRWRSACGSHASWPARPAG